MEATHRFGGNKLGGVNVALKKKRDRSNVKTEMIHDGDNWAELREIVQILTQ